MLEFLSIYWPLLLIVVAVITAIVIFAVRGKKQIVYKILYTLVTEAEEHLGSGTGALKFAEVMTKAYAMLPALIKTFISYETLSDWIEDVLKMAKEDWKKKSETPDAE